jgi:alpha-maltose-1-phosphate synthase
MRLTYLLLSPTFGMHQYTADLANRMVEEHDVHLVTSSRLPRDRYSPAVTIHTPVSFHNSGLSLQSLRLGALDVLDAVLQATRPHLVHVTGPHLWNGLLLRRLKQCGVPAIHTIHDLDAHPGTRLGNLLGLWNRAIVRQADVVLLHGQAYRSRLLAQGVPAGRLAYLPLLHLFLGFERQQALVRPRSLDNGIPSLAYEPFALFFGRLEAYKGINHLIAAFAQASGRLPPPARLVLAGPGRLEDVWAGSLPPGVEMANRLIGDEEALDLFSRCSLVVLPYIEATQSALVAAAYYFQKPVIVTGTGALPEYVEHGRTGWIVEKDDPASLERALLAAFCHPERLRLMGAAGRDWYDCQRVQEGVSLRDLYRQVASERVGEWASVGRQVER